MVKANDPREFDVIVVLGARVLPGGRPSAALERRVAHGVELFRQARSGSMLVTGGTPDERPAEAEVMRRLAVAEGVPEASILAEPTARSTLENAAACARLMRERGWTAALVVTDRLHLPRALLAFRGQGVEATGSAVKGGWRQEPFATWFYYLGHEAVALLWYGARILAGRHRP